MGPMDRVKWRGEPMTRRQRQAFLATEKEIEKEYRGFAFQVPQGSFQAQTAYSGTSHTKAGVVDLQYPGLYGDVGYSTRAEKAKYRFVLRALREVGRQAAFGRGPWDSLDGAPMILHFHTCDLDITGMSYTSAFFQVPQFLLGNNGLNAGVKDKFPYRRQPTRKWIYKK